jgi:hypothetical protein
MAVLYTKVYTSNLLRMLRNLLEETLTLLEETLTDLTRHILMCKVTKCLYKKLFYRDTNPTQLTAPACGFQTHMRSASHRSEGLHGVMTTLSDAGNKTSVVYPT